MADTLTILFWISLLLYAAEMLWLRAGMLRSSSVAAPPGDPTVSVIVAARNEEASIAGCIESLAVVNYPPDKLEIIIVNDHSTDRTAEVLSTAAQRYSNIKIITSTAGSGDMRGKANALSQGIEISRGEILAFTDADCRVPPGWIRSIVSQYDASTGIVGGYTLLRANGSFQGMQGLDWLFLCSVAAGTAGWGIPLTAIGNNLSVRRAAYDATGGFRDIPFSVTEDYALVQAILTRTRYSLKFPLDAAMTVESDPCESWASLFRQKQRWGVGGLDMVFRGLVIMAAGWVCKLLLLATLFSSGLVVAVPGFILKGAIDGWVLSAPLSRMGALRRLRYLVAFESYLIIYVLMLPFVALASKHRVVWKGRAIASNK